ncbi:Dual-specificity kinase, spindle pole body (SPB) duplication and spindle checkpoint function [Serendipita sp. 399]|nr:Dual-specificity kinase, spindle pole body (SPB) duplication and spindle checkpoint function [Serendipita sp. 399]
MARTSEKQSVEANAQSRPASRHRDLASSPRSSSASSDDGDISLDDEMLANGMAARRHYRLLEEKVEKLREAFRRDPRNRGLKDDQLKQALKSIQLSDPEEQLLYRELWEYVMRNGALGSQWEKYLARTREEQGKGTHARARGGSGIVEDDALEVKPTDHWEETEPATPLDAELRPWSALRSISTDILPSQGPASADGYSREHHSSPVEDRISSNLVPDSDYYQTPPFAHSGEPEPLQRNDLVSDEDEDDPPPKSRFDKLALNDTLQIRHSQMSQTGSSQQEPVTLPPSAIIYDPPPPPRSARSHKISPSTVTPAMSRNSNLSSMQERERPLPSRTEDHRKPELSVSMQSLPRGKGTSATKTPLNARQQVNRGTKSMSRRRIDDRDMGPASGDEKRAQSISRPNSSRGVRPDDDRRYSEDVQEQSPILDQGQYAPLSRPGPQRQISHQDAWQSSQAYPSHGADHIGRGTNGGPHRYPQTDQEIGRQAYGNGIPSASGRVTPGSLRSSGPPLQEGLKGITTMLVNGQSYQRLEVIGKGGSSKVFRVLRTKDFKQFALKKVELNAVDDESMRGYTEEIRLLKRLSGNKSVVSLVDDELRGKGSGTLYLMLEAVQVIHDERIVHSDLKPANFVLVRGMLKLIDFGIAKAIANDTTNIQRESQVGTVNYMSPETIDSTPDDEKRRKIGRASDVWSLGCILYQMVYGAPPFANLSFNMKALAITRDDYNIPFPEYSIPLSKEKTANGKQEPLEHLKVKVPWELRATMQACLRRDPKTRPTIVELLNESWLNGFYAADDASTVNSNVQRLAEDEAVISTHQVTELLNYCVPQLVPSWDPRTPANARKLHLLAEEIMPELQAMRSDNQYIL